MRYRVGVRRHSALGVQRAEERAIDERVAGLDGLVRFRQALDELVRDAALHVKAPRGCAPLSGGPDRAEEHGRDSEVEVGVRHDDGGIWDII